jgi:hypothetical protein
MFLGSDDYICPTEFLEYVTFVQRQSDADFVSCQVRYVDADGRKICGDYEHLLRAGATLKTAHWSNAPICMQVGGLSDGIAVLNETLSVKLKSGCRGRLMSYMDYATSVAKYAVRGYLTNSR